MGQVKSLLHDHSEFDTWVITRTLNPKRVDLSSNTQDEIYDTIEECGIYAKESLWYSRYHGRTFLEVYENYHKISPPLRSTDESFEDFVCRNLRQIESFKVKDYVDESGEQWRFVTNKPFENPEYNPALFLFVNNCIRECNVVLDDETVVTKISSSRCDQLDSCANKVDSCVQQVGNLVINFQKLKTAIVKFNFKTKYNDFIPPQIITTL